MNLQKTIITLRELGELMNPELPEVQAIAERAYQHNKWFTSENVFLMLNQIRQNFLCPEKLQPWLSEYSFEKQQAQKNVGIVMAGNIPLVGFHDLLCVMLSGHKALIKLSSKDDILLPWVLKKLFNIDESWKHSIAIAELLNGMDAVIATGSKNSSRYFEYYFSKYPHIIRKNRGSIAILNGNESSADLQKLGKDIFTYFGLGCRNVSKLYVPRHYSFDLFFDSIGGFSNMINH
ncbi:MAG: acyl-CoA reductase, partial [Chitinophagales bacterium]|nr:acyl-CoA reductase [Chitinophagales bacterium]